MKRLVTVAIAIFLLPSLSLAGKPVKQDVVVVTEQSRVVTIPGEYASLAEALAALEKEHIIPGATVTLQLAEGTYSSNQPLEFNHPDGKSIQILGDVSDPSTVVLQFIDSSGLVLSGTHLSLIDGVTISGNQVGGPYDKTGVLATAGASVNVGQHVIVEDFDVGMQAEYGGVIKADQTTVSNNTLHGFVATHGGIIHANGASATSNGGNGFFATNSGDIFCSSALATDNGDSGFAAFFGSHISVPLGTSSDNANFGYSAFQLSIIEATNAVASGNAYDYQLVPNTMGNYGEIIYDGSLPPP